MSADLTMPELHAVLDTGTRTLDGTPNICRVVELCKGPSDGFLAVFVNPSDTRELRLPTDRPFHVWRDSREHARMTLYRGIPTPPIQPQLMEDPR